MTSDSTCYVRRIAGLQATCIDPKGKNVDLKAHETGSSKSTGATHQVIAVNRPLGPVSVKTSVVLNEAERPVCSVTDLWTKGATLPSTPGGCETEMFGDIAVSSSQGGPLYPDDAHLKEDVGWWKRCLETVLWRSLVAVSRRFRCMSLQTLVFE